MGALKPSEGPGGVQERKSHETTRTDPGPSDASSYQERRLLSGSPQAIDGKQITELLQCRAKNI